MKRISKKVAEKGFEVIFGGKDDLNVFCPFHEDEETSRSRSCSINRKGIFNCKGCGVKGDVFKFFAHRYKITYQAAVTLLQKSKQAPTWAVVEACYERLNKNKPYLRYLQTKRGLTKTTLRQWQIGCDDRRITLPICDAESVLLNIRRYLPKPKPDEFKIISFKKGFGKVVLFPLHRVDKKKTIILCEGEWDCILLHQLGFNALTVTSGVTTWDPLFTPYFKNTNVVIIYDVNDKEDDLGQKIAWERARLLTTVAKSVKIVRLPLPKKYVGGDVTDFIVNESHTATELKQLIKKAPKFKIPAADVRASADVVDSTAPIKSKATKEVSLHEASQSKYYYQPIRLQCLVSGKDVAPFMPPQRVKLSVYDERGNVQSLEHTFDSWSGSVLSLIECSDSQLKNFICLLMGIPRKLVKDVEVLSTFNIEGIWVQPTVRDHFNYEAGPHTMTHCYYVGHGLQANRVYNFEGFTVPHPKNQQATHILTKATPAQTDVDSFTLTKTRQQQLARTFQAKTPDDVQKKFIDIHNQLSDHITHIYKRPDLHIAVDLTFHSVIGFHFDKVAVRKGWLDALILGDTRTGKGCVTESMCRHYGAGEVVSGENITLAGLIGGLQRLGDKWTLTWGKVPLADKRMIILDEAGTLSRHDIAKLSRIRSEGIAEITKIRSERTTSRTRLLWLANPRANKEQKSRVMAYYNYGIDTVPELVGAAEDVARFDFALIVAHNEVDLKLINKLHKPSGKLKYTPDLCHDLLMWVWSRTPKQVKFDKGVTAGIMKASRQLAQYFTSKIPLIQGEDVRFKLARLACAVAGRLFSTKDYVNLLVKQEHVDFAYNFLYHIYSKPVCGYAQFSAIDKERNSLRQPAQVEAVLEEVGEMRNDLIDGLLEHQQLSARDLCDYTGLEVFQARSLISQLVRLRALIKEYGYYVKKPAFKTFLRKLKAKHSKEFNVTM